MNSSNAGYCFVDFEGPDAAARALQLNGSLIPNSNRPFKLNWASGGGLADRRYVCRLKTALESPANIPKPRRAWTRVLDLCRRSRP